jgi:hydrogenase maturation protease
VGLRFAEDLGRLNPTHFFSEEQGLEEAVLEIITRKDVDSVVFVDTCDIGAEPGEIAFLKGDSIGESITTHKVPLSLLMGLIQKEGKKAHLVGIQPESLDFGKGISKIAAASLASLEDVVRRKLG